MNLFPGTLTSKNGQPVFQLDATNTLDSEPLSVLLNNDQAHRLTPHIGKPLIMGLRPEHVLEQQATPSGSPGFSVEANVELVELLGAEAHLHLSAGPRTFIAKVRANTCARATQRIPITFDLPHAHFFEPETGKSLK
jgi:multiple sugar transport system ATP-binding protein